MEATNQPVSTAARLSVYKRLPDNSTINVDCWRYGLAIYSSWFQLARGMQILWSTVRSSVMEGDKKKVGESDEVLRIS